MTNSKLRLYTWQNLQNSAYTTFSKVGQADARPNTFFSDHNFKDYNFYKIH